MEDKEIPSFAEKEGVLKALASSQRLRVLSLVLHHEEICAKEISEKLELSQPDISYHLSKLQQARLITKSRNGVKHCYDINEMLLEKMGIDPGILLD